MKREYYTVGIVGREYEVESSNEQDASRHPSESRQPRGWRPKKRSNAWLLVYVPAAVLAEILYAMYSMSFAPVAARVCYGFILGAAVWLVYFRLVGREPASGQTKHSGLHFGAACPYCGAFYQYPESKLDSDGTVECQNCAIRFGMTQPARPISLDTDADG